MDDTLPQSATTTSVNQNPVQDGLVDALSLDSANHSLQVAPAVALDHDQAQVSAIGDDDTSSLNQDDGVITQTISQTSSPTTPLDNNSTDPTQAVAGSVVRAVVQGAQQPVQAATPVGSAADKERVVGSGLQSEHLQPPESHETHEVEPEVESWMEKLEQAGEIKLPEAIKDEHGAVVLDNAPATVIHDQIVVPMSQQGMQLAKKKPITDAAKWLGFWVERIAKMFGARVKFKES